MGEGVGENHFTTLLSFEELSLSLSLSILSECARVLGWSAGPGNRYSFAVARHKG